MGVGKAQIHTKHSETNVRISCVSGLIKYVLLSPMNIMCLWILRPLKRVETDSCVFWF